MKQVFSVLSIVCVAFFAVLLTSTSTGCKKGDTGPKGDTGNANVQYSGWLDVTYDAVTNQAGDTVYYFEASIPAPKLQDSILAKGDVRVFVNVGTTAQPQILSLPYGYSIVPAFRKGAIDLQADDDYGTFTQSGQKFNQYRYILINGSVPARAATDYNTLKELYNIED